MHDIGRYKDEDGDHAYWSAELAPKFIDECKLDISKKSIDKITKIIKYHGTQDEKLPAELIDCLELKILVDADRIDSFGALGIIRAPLDERYQKSYKEQINHIQQKADPKNYRLRTNGGLKVGKRYKDFLHNFLIEYEYQIKDCS